MPKATFDQRDSLEASLEVAWLIARAIKRHNTAEELIKPDATTITEIMCEKEQAAKLGTVPLSARTVSKRLDELVQNIKDQLSIAIKKNVLFAMKLDETLTSGAILSSWYTSDFELNTGSEQRSCSGTSWKQQLVDSMFSTWLTNFLHLEM
ncbi:SCAN domain-containing protein 3 [Oopsacas minuta]|uniref:SCAN domain-containing protein 3 n=1 Tax=Oopsacas minuta TaxID=111878 RepID=A0AAV7JMM7_9METZ|nr:SCAN domain-containing protein 3 [Oopsacas minuta]